MNTVRVVAVVLLVLMAARPARAQNPVPWSGSVSQSVARAREQSLPLLFWVTDGRDVGTDDDELSDAQEGCFRDPVVHRTIQSRFVPVRVSRNSKVLEEAARLGLPTSHGLYCAVLTADGRLLAQMGPFEVADPAAFQAALVRAFDQYCADLYEHELRPLLEDPASPKPKARLAAQTVWRLGMRSADRGIIALLGRGDLQPGEKARLYELLAALGTEACVATLLDKAEDPAALKAMLRAGPGALEWLTPSLPAEDGPVTARQMAAYQGCVYASRLGSPKAAAWWEKAKPEERRKELERVREKAGTVLEYWRQTEGAR